MSVREEYSPFCTTFIWFECCFKSLFKASPRIRFNKDGTLLAVSANENGIKILANSDGLRMLRAFESYDASRASESMTKVTAYRIGRSCDKSLLPDVDLLI